MKWSPSTLRFYSLSIALKMKSYCPVISFQTSKLGSKECLEHNLIVPYPVLTEKPGEIVAQFKATVAILKGGTAVLCGIPLDTQGIDSHVKIEDEKLNELLAVQFDSNVDINEPC